MRFLSEKEVLKMAKKLKKVRKGMNPKVKFTLANSFKGLISNQAVIDGSRGSPWWVAAIFLVFSSLLPLLPTFSQLNKMNGASFISGYNYGLQEQLAHFAYTEKTAGGEFVVEGGQLHYELNGTRDDSKFIQPQDYPTYFDERRCEFKVISNVNNQIEAKFYFWQDEDLSKNVKEIVKQTYLVKGNNGSDGQGIPNPEDKTNQEYLPNIIILTPKTMAVALYKRDTKTAAGTTYGGLDWLNSSTAKGLIARLVSGADEVEWSSLTESEFVNNYSETTLKEFRKICTETYLTQKNKTKWINTGIYLAIYTGVIVFLGLMVFILTRGKNNPYKFLNIWECQKISWWGAVSPAIIGTLLSLIFSGNAIGQMAFILVVSLRIMWLSMKQLRPVVQ